MELGGNCRLQDVLEIDTRSLEGGLGRRHGLLRARELDERPGLVVGADKLGMNLRVRVSQAVLGPIQACMGCRK